LLAAKLEIEFRVCVLCNSISTDLMWSMKSLDTK
jgi:hypothetical protein